MRGNELYSIRIISKYFPIWKKPDKLVTILLDLKKRIYSKNPDSMSLTMTAELSDVFKSKKEGVYYILDSASQAFNNDSYSVLNIGAKLITVDEAKTDPMEVAGANWVATGWLVSNKIENCVIIDVGSTSTSIIPIINGKISAKGETDFEKLIVGELVYTGALRTNIAAIVNEVPVGEKKVSISSEFFSQSGDVHLILGNLNQEDYLVETPDKRGKESIDAMRRLARIVCADFEILKEYEIKKIAEHIYSKQIYQISSGLRKVYSCLDLNNKKEIPIVTTGIGKNFLAEKAARQLGIKKIFDINQIIDNSTFKATPAVGVAIMEASKLLGRNVIWKH